MWDDLKLWLSLNPGAVGLAAALFALMTWANLFGGMT